MPDKDLQTWMPAPTSFAEAAKMAEWLARSTLVPESYRGKPADVLIVADFGRRLGLPLLTALQGIAIIKGKPTVWGDCQLALCRAHPAFRGCEVKVAGEGINMVATATVRREGEIPTIRSFSMREAEQASLTNKSTWQQYPGRMLSARARSWALRDAFADALMGIGSAEELVDVDPDQTVPIERVVDADELLLAESQAGSSSRACVECGEPVLSRAPRAQRCPTHIGAPKASRRGKADTAAAPAPAQRKAAEPAEAPPPVAVRSTPGEFESAMQAAATEPDLVAIGREAGAAITSEAALVRLRRVFADRLAAIKCGDGAGILGGPAAPATAEGVAGLRARQAEREGK